MKVALQKLELSDKEELNSLQLTLENRDVL